jgi:hypothetical protein
MAKRQGFWGLWNAQPERERFSLGELKHLHDVLQQNSIVTDHNREVVVETLRSIAELMIWGDQHDPLFFDYFAENNLIHFFSKLFEQRGNRQGDVAKQVHVLTKLGHASFGANALHARSLFALLHASACQPGMPCLMLARRRCCKRSPF